jgi:Neuraminidase-like domain/Putative peptidoglycan binding domain/Salmonella virulence plasmid 28.1kDa A protein
MTLAGRNLQQGLTGSDVGELQTQLAQLSYTVPGTEQQASSFGTGTLAAVQQFQTEQGLASNGIVDAATAAALTAAIAANTYVVTGTVSSPVSAAVAGLTVQLVDKNVGGDVTVASSQANSAGAYKISAVISPATLRGKSKTQPDLQVQVLSGATLLAASAVLYNAPMSVTLNVSLPPNASGLASEYESLTAGISALYKGQLSALQEGLQQQDITFLANKSGWDARAVAMAALADQFSQITAPAPATTPPAPASATATAPAAPGNLTASTSVPAATVPVKVAPVTPEPIPVKPLPIPTAPLTTVPSAAAPPPATAAPAAPAPPTPAPPAPAPPAPATVSLSPEFYYALFRAGIPADSNSLFRTPSSSVQAIWQQAIAQGVIPQALASQVPNAIQSYQTLAATNLLTAAPVVGASTLGEMLTVSNLSAANQATFAQILAQHADDSTTFWNNISASLGATVAKQLQLDGQMFYLSLNNTSLVSALYAAEGKNGALTSPVDLVARGYYEAAKWTPLIGSSTPPQIPGQNVDNYAAFLAAQVRLSFPTAVAGDQVKRGIFPISDTAAVASGVSTFLANNYSEFAIGAEPVEAFIARNKVANVAPAVVTQIKRLQRVLQLTPDDQSMAVLLGHNLDSAYAITRYDSAGFLRAFQDKLGGAGNASATYARARHIYSSVLNLAIGYLGARQAPTLGGVSTILSGFPSAPSTQTYPVVAYPTLESLFGSLDYCSCSDCGSILSPAAYLVDLLHYIDQPAPSPTFDNPQTVLLQRRPDLQYLPLTCDNTNTALPYIDIVNETLEYYVANQLSLANFQGYSTDDTVTSAELLASPQFVNDAAYTILQGAFFPPPLPFNRPLAQLRQLFQNMGAALPDVMAALGTSDSTAINQSGSGYSAADILIEQLGISRDEYRIFTDGTLQLPLLYGYSGTAAAVLATLQSITLQDFSRRTGVSYADLVSILETQFINPNAILIERLERLNVPFSTLQKLNSDPSTGPAFIQGLPAGLDARAYGGSASTDWNAVVQWVTNAANFTRISNIITLSNPTNNANECSGASFQFRYLNGNKLTQTDFEKLIRFIRLWQKLGLSIEQTDDILSALYPAANLPTGTNDAANLPLLDAGFQVALPRIGVLFQVMNRLSLTANQSLGSLLACWAPIGTVGENALYQQMFGGPTLQREDPGAPIATIGGGPNGGDTLITTINTLALSQLVNAGDTPTAIATNIAALINGTATNDPTTGVPLNQRIAASSQNAVITIRAGFKLNCTVAPGTPTGTPTETFNFQSPSPLSHTATVGGTITAGDELTAIINTVPITYIVLASDSLTSIAANIATAINNTSSPDPYSALPLNSLLVAWSNGQFITINSVNSGAPLSLECSLTQGGTGAYTAAAQVPAYQTATVGGTVASGDVLTTTVNGLAIPFTVTTQTTAAAVAAAIVTTINGITTPDPTSGMPINSILHATSASNGVAITITASDPATALTLTCSATGGMTYTQSGPVPTSQAATVSGAFAAGGILTTTINDASVQYTVAAGDTPTSIATNIAGAINAYAAVDPLTNVAVNLLVSAAAAAGVITITSRSATGGFSLTVSTSSGTYTAGVQPPPFADNGYGDFLADPSQTLFGHEPVLRAAFNLTGAEFTLIATALQFTSSTPLTLANISSVFCIGWFAHTLGISVAEFLLLRQTTGLDPFAPLDPGPGPAVEPPVVRFIWLVQAMSNAGLRPVQALYLLWNQDISGKSTPDIDVITGLAFALRAAFAAVAAQFTIQSDPDGTIAKSLMALVYGNTATGFYFGLLNNTLVTQIDYPNSNYPSPQPAPVQAVLDASGGRLSYDNLRKQLSFAGVLDKGTLTAIQTAITADQNFPALTQALNDLAVANQQMVGPFFATYPELRPLYLAYAASTDPVQQKRSTLLANFLPTLIQKRNQEQALATVTAAAGTDPSYANALLDDPTILHAAADATAPIVNDLTALNMPGLAAQIFLSNSIAGSPDMVLDADPASYAPSAIGAQQTATVSGKITPGNILTTVVNSVAIPYTVASTDRMPADVAAGIATAIAGTPTPDPFSGLPLKDVVSATAAGGVITVQAANSGAGVAVNCSVQPVAPTPPTYVVGPPVPASQTATLAGAITAGDVLTTTINTVAVAYTVVASDTSATILAAHIASAINATATADPLSGLPLNQAVSASSAAAVVTVTAAAFGPDFTLTCSVSASATETYTAGSQAVASQTATLSGLLPANDSVITTINNVAVQYTVAPGDTTLAGLVANVAAAINANTTVDSVTNKALNTIVKASSAAGVLTIASIPPGVPFSLSCSLALGAYTLGTQVSILQTATVAGGITANDTLMTTVNGITVIYTVTGAEAGLSVVAANIAAAVSGTAALNPVVSATNIGGIVIFRAAGSNGFTLTCSTSPAATASYSTGPQFSAWQATVSGGFSTGDILTTNVDDASVVYPIGAADTTPSAIAAHIVTTINASTTTDPVTGLPVNGVVIASSAAGVITFRSAGPAVVMSCSLSAGATEHYAIAGELPARPGGGPIAGIWSGYLNAPQDGFYNIEIETDPGAAVTLTIDGSLVSLAPSSNASVWSNQSPISLTAGQLVPIKFTALSLQSSLALNWQSSGLGWQTIPAGYLYSDTLVDRLQTAYVRFLKATSLATALSLTADEIAYLGTGANYAVNTTDSLDNLAPGTVTFTPASMTNIKKGSLLVIDSGAAQEIVTVTAISATATTFTAVTINPHNGKVTPVPIADVPNASTGQGWLNLLAVSLISGSATAALQFVSTYAAGLRIFASQTATIGGTIKAGDILTATIDGVAIAYTVAGTDTLATIAANIAAKINASISPDPHSGLPLNQAISASNSGAVIILTALVFGPDFTLSCAVSGGATETFTAGAATPASQTATISAVFPANSVLVTNVNSVAVEYTVLPTDTTPTVLAANVVTAINATTTVDSVSNLPLNSFVKASNAGGVVTITTVSPGAPLTLSCSVASLRGVLRDLLNFSRIKAAISPNDEQVLDVLENPNLMSADGVTPVIVKLTGWASSSLNALLQNFFGTSRLSSLSAVENLRKVFDAFAFVTSCRLSAAALLAATTNAPSPSTVASLQSALRALYAPSDWLNVIKPINDALRIQQRDALVAYILQQLGDRYSSSLLSLTTTADAPAGSATLTFAGVAGIQAGMAVQGLNIPANATVTGIGGATVTLSIAVSADVPSGSSVVLVPPTALNITTADNLFEYFLIDVETQPPVQTSRIRLALSSIQLFIERVLRNLEPQTQPSNIDGSLWTWMKRYRVWQANREVFLWPENWLYPELRDDQSPIFEQMMSSLLQSDITDDAAAAAYLDYLSNLELVAKLEPCGFYYIPASGDSDENSYVVARTAGAHRKYYFRQLQYGSWTPWTEVQIDCEDMPVTPIVWNGRLLLFWVKINKTTTPQPAVSTTLSNDHNSGDPVTNLSLNDFQQFGQNTAVLQTKGNITVSAILCWSEFYNGKWQPQKSSDVHRPTTIGSYDTDGFDADRNLLQIIPVNVAQYYGEPQPKNRGTVQSTLPSDALLLGICSPLTSSPICPSYGGGFVFYNTHSLPVCWEDIYLQVKFLHEEWFAQLNWLTLPAGPGRTFQPILPYTGGTANSSSLPSFGISYWTLTSNLAPFGGVPPAFSTSFQNNLLGLNRVPRTVDSIPNTPGWYYPFLFEDRRNVFYVTTTQTSGILSFIPTYGYGIANLNYTLSPNISGLVASVAATISQRTPFAAGTLVSGDDTTEIGRYVAQGGTIRVAISSVAPVNYQSAVLYPSGQFQNQSAALPTGLLGTKTTK